MKENENNQPNHAEGNFGLPGDYFQRSAASIFNKIEWQEEHNQFPALLNYKKDPGFRIPVNYFEIQETQLELLEFLALQAIQKTNAFNVPAAYFERSEEALLSAHLIETENELAGFELLKTLSKQTNFKTPDHYFAENKITLAEISVPKQAKIIPLFYERTWYVAAAVLVIALGFWTYSDYYKPAEVKDCGTLACIDKADLVKTKTLEKLDNEDLYEIVNTKKLEENLNSDAVKKNEGIKNDSSANTDAVDDLLDEI